MCNAVCVLHLAHGGRRSGANRHPYRAQFRSCTTRTGIAPDRRRQGVPVCVVQARVCVCVCACVRVCACVWDHVCVCMRVSIACARVRVHAYVHTLMCAHVCMRWCVHVCCAAALSACARSFGEPRLIGVDRPSKYVQTFYNGRETHKNTPTHPHTHLCPVRL